MSARFHRVVWAEPWSANGPGWSNSGVTGEIEFIDEGGVHREKVTVYEQDLELANMVAFQFALVAVKHMRQAIEKAGQKFVEDMNDDTEWPPIKPGTRVRISDQPKGAQDWADGAIQLRTLWGREGVVVEHHDSHGLFYDVSVEGMQMPCNPEELTALD